MKTYTAFLLASLITTAALAEGFKYRCQFYSIDAGDKALSDASTTFDSAVQTSTVEIKVDNYSFRIFKRNVHNSGESIVMRIDSEQGVAATEAPMGTPWIAVFNRPIGTSTTKSAQLSCWLIKEATTLVETP